jgi:hypothetical protein
LLHKFPRDKEGHNHGTGQGMAVNIGIKKKEMKAAGYS